MNDLAEIQQLLKAVAELLQSGAKNDKRAAAVKLDRISDIASTLALTLRMHG